MWRWAWLVVLVLGAPGCAGATYRPISNEVQRVPSGTVRLVEATRRDPVEDELTLATELEPGTRLRTAGYSTEGNGCPEPPASLQLIDGEPRSEMQPVPLDGQHTLTLNIGPQRDRTLALETERFGTRICERIALAWPRGWERAPFWLAELRLGYTQITSGPKVGGIRLLMARWTGPLRVGAEVGLVNNLVCDDDEDCPQRFALPLALEANRSWGPGSLLYVVVGARPQVLLAQAEPGGPLRVQAYTLLATGELLVGASLRPEDEAPAGGEIGLGIVAGPALVVDQPEAHAGFAFGFQFSYGVMP